jgi:hypothetical protein
MEPTQDNQTIGGGLIGSAQREDRAYRTDLATAKAPQSRINNAADNAHAALGRLNDRIGILQKRLSPVSSPLPQPGESDMEDPGGSEVTSNFYSLARKADNLVGMVERMIEELEI